MVRDNKFLEDLLEKGMIFCESCKYPKRGKDYFAFCDFLTSKEKVWCGTQNPIL